MRPLIPALASLAALSLPAAPCGPRPPIPPFRLHWETASAASRTASRRMGIHGGRRRGGLRLLRRWPARGLCGRRHLAAALFRNTSTPGGAWPLRRGQRAGADRGLGRLSLDIDGDGVLDLAVLRVGPDRLMRPGRLPVPGCLGRLGVRRAGPVVHGLRRHLGNRARPGPRWPSAATSTARKRPSPGGSCTPNHLYRPNAAGTGFAPPRPDPRLLRDCPSCSRLGPPGTPDLRVSNDREYYKGGQEQMWRLEPGQPPVAFSEADGWQRLRIWGMGIARKT